MSDLNVSLTLLNIAMVWTQAVTTAKNALGLAGNGRHDEHLLCEDRRESAEPGSAPSWSKPSTATDGQLRLFLSPITPGLDRLFVEVPEKPGKSA